MDWWRIIHVLALIWMGAGFGASYLMVLRAYGTKDLKLRMYCLIEAANNETRVLLPGAMLSGATGFFWGVAAEYHIFRDAWFGVLGLLFIFFWLVCLPLYGFGLRRARIAALTAQKKGEETEELRQV